MFNFSYNQNTGFNDDETPWYLTLNASWSMWDGGNRIGRVREANSQQTSALLYKNQLEEQITVAVKDVWQKLAGSESRLTSLDLEENLATENLTLAEREFAAGHNTWVDVDLARLTLMQTQFAKASGYIERQLLAVELLATCGEL